MVTEKSLGQDNPALDIQETDFSVVDIEITPKEKEKENVKNSVDNDSKPEDDRDVTNGGGKDGAPPRVKFVRDSADTSSSGYRDSDAESSDGGEEVSLLYSRHEKIPMKDFAAEIRASLDVENFLSQAQLILDMGENNMESIIDKLLHHLLSQEGTENTIIEEAKKSLFTHDSVHQLAKTIQGTCNIYGGGFDYDQSWVCVLCTVPSAQKRHVAIARLKSPANLGRTSQEVYFIILVVTPSKEKGTKNALETGRTFATLFSDIDLRLLLLAARSEDEFKHLMWEHMKELAEEQNGDRKMSDSSSGHAPPEVTACSETKSKCFFANGLRSDFMRRLGFYLSDFKDGMKPLMQIRNSKRMHN